MSALKALPRAIGLVGRNPVVVLPAVLLAALSTTNVATQLGPPNVVLAVVQLFVALAQFLIVPFTAAGLYGMLNEGRTDSASLGAFWRTGKEYFLYLLGANLIVGVLYAVLGGLVAVGVLAAIGFGSIEAIVNGAPPLEAIGTTGTAAIAVGFLLLLVVQLFVQFYDAALVLGDAGFFGSISRSVGLVRDNIISAVGFTVINQVVGLAIVLPALAYLSPRLQDVPTSSMEELAAFINSLGSDPVVIALVLVTSIVSTTFVYAYKTAFYVRIDPAVDASPTTN